MSCVDSILWKMAVCGCGLPPHVMAYNSLIDGQLERRSTTSGVSPPPLVFMFTLYATFTLNKVDQSETVLDE